VAGLFNLRKKASGGVVVAAGSDGTEILLQKTNKKLFKNSAARKKN
jgi:hypothetical protein